MDRILSLLPDDAESRGEIARRAINALVGGEQVMDMVFAHHAGRSHRQLAEDYGTSHTAIGTRIRTAHRHLRMLGIMPAAWEPQPKSKRPISAS